MVGSGRACKSHNLAHKLGHGGWAPLDAWFVAKPIALAYTSEN
jgi:hypothetical protein